MAAYGEKPIAGSTLHRASAPGERQTWGDVSGNYFHVRRGPDYKRHGHKSPSDESIYELITVDIFETSSPQLHVAERFVLPTPPVTDESLPLPPLLILNCILPKEAPAVVGKSNESSIQLVMYYGLRHSMVDEAKNPTRNSTRLLRKWVQEAPHRDDVRHTLKFIAVVNNIETLKLGSFLEGYNGKPVLVTKSGSLHQGGGAGTGSVRYMEIGMNVHKFNIVARKAFTSVKDRIKDFDARVAFVIQGHGDDELPEQILACAALHFIDLSQIVRMF